MAVSEGQHEGSSDGGKMLIHQQIPCFGREIVLNCAQRVVLLLKCEVFVTISCVAVGFAVSESTPVRGCVFAGCWVRGFDNIDPRRLVGRAAALDCPLKKVTAVRNARGASLVQ